jgi:hypothetical protein
VANLSHRPPRLSSAAPLTTEPTPPEPRCPQTISFAARVQVLSPPKSEVHLSPDVARNDVATPTYDESSILSNFSLAVLMDTGWYTVDARAAPADKPMQWGLGLPQPFLQNGFTAGKQVRETQLRQNGGQWACLWCT